MKYTKYVLTLAFLAVSIGCSTAANGEQNNAGSQNSGDSGTASSDSGSGISESQTAAPDAVVKELYKLHDADKSPLYKAENRAEMGKFFSKSFLDVIWVKTDKGEDNSMNKLAIEGDALYGISGLGKAKNLNVDKAKINGDKATVTANFETSEDDGKYEKSSATYEMVKENSGWRIADIKIDGFYSGSLIGTVTNLEKTSKEENKKLDEEFKDVKPPFVGKRWFVTDRENSGSGTPQYYLKINENNYAFCGFVQTNQADGTVTEEEIPLGKFRKTFDCNFKNELGGKHSYQVEENYIYELDANKKIIQSSKAEFVQ